MTMRSGTKSLYFTIRFAERAETIAFFAALTLLSGLSQMILAWTTFQQSSQSG